MTGDHASPIALREDVVWREADGSIIVLDTRSSRYLTVGGSGPLLWPLVADGTSMPELAAALTAAFQISEPDAVRDVASFVDGLRGHGLLVD